jgi:hypothetical protein
LFLNERLYHVKKIGKFSYESGIWDRMGLASSFSMAHTNSRTRSQSYSASTKIGATFKFLEFFSIGMDGQFLISKATQDTEAQANSLAVTNSIDLEKQRNTYSVEFLEYDECRRIRMNPSLFRPELSFFGKIERFFNGTNYYKHLNTSLPGEKIINTLNKGFLICSKPEKMVPLKKHENFYIIQERVENREYQESGDKRNRRLFLTLRGDADFLRFEHFTKNGVELPEGFYLDQMSSEAINERFLRAFQLRPSVPKVFIDSP